MILAAVLEVGGDALIRAGLRGKGFLLVVAGFGVLGSYGVVVNLLPMDFSKLLGGYVGFFAIVSVLGGRLVFKETVSPSTWVGLAIILVGSLIIQSGSMRPSVKRSSETVARAQPTQAAETPEREKQQRAAAAVPSTSPARIRQSPSGSAEP
jgi:drug/metabolite transporter superfamily protein YnfA